MEQFMDLFAGTFLDGFFQLKEGEYLEPSIKKGETEVVIDKMSDAEKRVLTLIYMRFEEIEKLSLKLEIDSEILDRLLHSADGTLFDDILEVAENLYKKQDVEFPWDIWDIFLREVGSYQRLIGLLDGLIYTRLMPKYICSKPIFRKGFLIVKDGFEIMEEDCSFEDGEKISNQNYPLN